MNKQEAELFSKAAKDHLDRNKIEVDGYGYMAVPVASRVRASIDANYLTVFILPDTEVEVNRDVAFIVSKTFKGDTIAMQKKHIGFAIGKSGRNISKLVKKLDRRITFTEL